ncbi:MAG TPA: XRE family transcriptional regulator [Thermomicrobiales bacterium]|jgi:transcriptional regulator with XRE-family HTH domain|nr:XRE family transcriptional regulator [Thermomicrobiales bacterium]
MVQDSAPDDQDAITLAAAIGGRVRRGRIARSWTLDQLAEATGVSRRMLINVEQGVANPSVGTLLRISAALGIGLPALVEPPRPDPVRITRRGEGATLWSGAEGSRGVLVTGTTPPDIVELWEWTLVPGDEYRSEAHTPGTQELLQVREGSLTIRIGERSIVLEAGDAVSFTAETDHAYANRGATPTHYTMIVFEPGVDTANRPEVSRG